jgi:hypothetical protein
MPCDEYDGDANVPLGKFSLKLESVETRQTNVQDEATVDLRNVAQQ